jgi:hypothetical protein
MSEGTTAAAIATSNVLRVVVKTLIESGVLDLKALRDNLAGGRSVCPNQEILELYDTLCVFVVAEQRETIAAGRNP